MLSSMRIVDVGKEIEDDDSSEERRSSEKGIVLDGGGFDGVDAKTFATILE